ncbi:hypothetical protein WJX81_002004 [Elliptochloris bilobata]|uniref:BTB domain-containing protein n=1 Tax=Elliptochloris bilobata TaxID=381761 RepID=A0AAW1QIS5_9CHLO
MVENSAAAVAKETPTTAVPKPKRRGDKAKKADGQQAKEPAAAEKIEAEDVKEGSVLTVIQRRLRAVNKKIKKCEEIEQARAAGKEINDQQEEVLSGKAKALANVEELERLVPLLREALEEDQKAAAERAAGAAATSARKEVEAALAAQETELSELRKAKEAAAKEAAEAAAKAQADAADAAAALAAAREATAAAEAAPPKEEAVAPLLARLVQLVYFGQMFMENGTEIPSLERLACVTYDEQRARESDMQGADLKVEDLLDISEFCKLVTQRPDGEAIAHKNALARCEELALKFVFAKDETVPPLSVTAAHLLERMGRVLALEEYQEAVPQIVDRPPAQEDAGAPALEAAKRSLDMHNIYAPQGLSGSGHLPAGVPGADVPFSSGYSAPMPPTPQPAAHAAPRDYPLFQHHTAPGGYHPGEPANPNSAMNPSQAGLPNGGAGAPFYGGHVSGLHFGGLQFGSVAPEEAAAGLARPPTHGALAPLTQAPPVSAALLAQAPAVARPQPATLDASHGAFGSVGDGVGPGAGAGAAEVGGGVPRGTSYGSDDAGISYYFVRARKAGPRSDIYAAARVGDLERARHLVDVEGVDVNARDRWDSVPLYYACACGHEEVARLLLEAGAQCNEFTFDGDRCHYAALTPAIRALLRQYEQRPPPLAPLAAALRPLAPADGGAGPAPAQIGSACRAELVIVVAGERVALHRAVAAARSPLLRRRLLGPWALQEGCAQREVWLRPSSLTPSAVRSLAAFLYTDRLDAPVEDAEVLVRAARRLGLREAAAAFAAERRTLQYYFKSTRLNDAVPRRFVLQPGALPEGARLGAHLGRLRAKAVALEAAGAAGAGADLADVRVRVGPRAFRCHRCILAARSEYFRALLERSLEAVGLTDVSVAAEGPGAGLGLGSGQGSQLPEAAIGGIGPSAFEIVLRFVYTDSIAKGGCSGAAPGSQGSDAHMCGDEDCGGWRDLETADELLFAADLFLLFSLKREVGDSVAAAWASSPPGMEPLVRMLLAADRARQLGYRYTNGITGASHGNIEGGGIGGAGVGTLLFDLREAYLEDRGGAGEMRDTCAAHFDVGTEDAAKGMCGAPPS